MNRPRKDFAYDTLELKPVFELPCTTSDAVRNHISNPYVNSRFNHERILTRCTNSSIFKGSLNIDYNQAENQYPNEFSSLYEGL